MAGAPPRGTEPEPDRRRGVLAPVNLAPHMERPAMGVREPDKDAGYDAMLGELSNTELLQVMKSLETDPLAAADDNMFPLELPDPEPDSDSAEEKIKQAQVRLERRCAFLSRRLRILQARAIGKRVSEEASQAFEKCARGTRKDGGGRSLGLKAFVKRVETTANLQASAASKSVVGPKYYNVGSSRGDASKASFVGVSSGSLTGLEDTAGALVSHLSVVKRELDSDATASSSGAESNDEAVPYNNPHQQPMPLEKRALWSWQRSRASLAARWGWLQAQVQELDYKIRQHDDLHRQVREAKGPVEFEGEPPKADDEGVSPAAPAGYQGALPGDSDDGPETCARVRPLRRETFKKRKLLQMHNLHVATPKAAKPSDIHCSCEYPLESCPVCTGRADPTLPEPAVLPPRQRLALVDPGYHPVLSDIRDVSPATHMAALCSRSWFRARGRPRAPPAPAPAPAPVVHTHTHKHPKKHKSKRGRPPLSRKIRERDRDEDAAASGTESHSVDGGASFTSPPYAFPRATLFGMYPGETHRLHRRGRVRGSTESRGWRRQSYDIDNIVIPHSVAAATRPMILEYKEIITPKWRVNEIPEMPLNNGISKSNRTSTEESEDEDISPAAVAARHARAECRERSRYMRKQRARRSHHDAETDAAPPAHAPPPPPPTNTLPASPHETVKPYSPRQFPLKEDTYQEMLSAMPEGYRPPSPQAPSPGDLNPPPGSRTPPSGFRTPPPPADSPDEDSSTLSPVSVSVYEGDDPDDMEWEPSVEKAEPRRKSTFR